MPAFQVFKRYGWDSTTYLVANVYGREIYDEYSDELDAIKKAKELNGFHALIAGEAMKLEKAKDG